MSDSQPNSDEQPEHRKAKKPRSLRITARMMVRMLRPFLMGLAATGIFNVTVLNRPTELVKDGSFVLFSNHRSYSDPFFLFGAMRRVVTFMSMSDVWKWPVAGWFMRIMGHIPVDRKDPVSREQALRLATEIPEHGGIVGIFGEGRMYDFAYDDPKQVIGPLQMGAIHVVFETGAPLLVCGMVGTSEVYPPRKGAKLNRKAKVIVHFATELLHRDRYLEDAGVEPGAEPTKEQIDRAKRWMLSDAGLLMSMLIRTAPEVAARQKK
jgi:1-acyl-sn-glycerol-3-phosphate acyltransferase